MDGLMNILSTATQQGEGDKVCELIEECGGLDKIEDLQSHENESVYKKALSIITTFFGEEEVSQKKVLDLAKKWELKLSKNKWKLSLHK